MSLRVFLEIAGIRFAARSAQAGPLAAWGKHYRPFLESTYCGPHHLDIEVRFEPQDMPDIHTLTRVFDAERLWSVYQQGSDRFLSVNTPSQGQPAFLARFDPKVRHVTIYHNETANDAGHDPLSRNPLRDPLDYLLVMYALAHAGGAIFHAAGAGIAGKGFVFPGRSGAGKTTLSRQIIRRQTVEPLSDDRVIVRRIGDQFVAFGTPWPGDAGIANNKAFPLVALLFLNHGATTQAHPLSAKDALDRLLPVTSVPWYDRELVPGMLSFFEDLVQHVPAFDLHFQPTDHVVDLLETLASQY